MYIDPWDYDKSLLVDKLDRLVRRKAIIALQRFTLISTIINSLIPGWWYAAMGYGL